MMTDLPPAADAEARILEWLLARNPELQAIPDDMDLIENRVIDSLDFMEFVFLLEEVTGRSNLLDGVSVDAFRSLAAIRSTFLAG